ncbi:hypothetical protein LCGC14_3161140 [marine sediment metagenome]|uniref:Uncharacterized protein n=1 Tax=marine sediment metagenome TaxID=412755 RepID=A0A0F8XY02_9ZZZZ
MKSSEAPACTCGSKKAGLIWIAKEKRYQCGTCIQKVYAALGNMPKGMDDLLKIVDRTTTGNLAHNKAVLSGAIGHLKCYLESAHGLTKKEKPTSTPAKWDNTCKTCGACDGRCGITIDGECLNCKDTRKQGRFVLHSNLDRTPKEMEMTGKILR